jgi:diguanylate cyclase (GGDEF) domain
MYVDKTAGSAESIQILARWASIAFATFSALFTWYMKAFAWQWAIGLALAYLLYNLSLCRRKAAPGISELFLNLVLCAGLTLVQFGYNDILYQLLLLRMALHVGSRRAARIAVIVAAVQLTATVAVTVSFTAVAVFGILGNLLTTVILTYAAVYLDIRFGRQVSDDRQMLELIRQNDHNYRMAFTDALTGLYNHRAYKERVDALNQYVILFIDIDHFKKLNDTHGHLVGDRVLVNLGGIITQSVRSGDLAFRYGGEEFIILLPGTTAQIGLKIAERLRMKVADGNFESDNGRLTVTVSVGVAMKRPGMKSQTVFEQADRALYLAKQLGRNNVQSCFQPEVAPNMAAAGQNSHR